MLWAAAHDTPRFKQGLVDNLGGEAAAILQAKQELLIHVGSNRRADYPHPVTGAPAHRCPKGAFEDIIDSQADINMFYVTKKEKKIYTQLRKATVSIIFVDILSMRQKPCCLIPRLI